MAGGGGASALHGAAEAGDAGLVRSLLARGHGASPRDAWGATPLHYAATRGAAGAAGELLRGGADPGAEDEEGLRPVHWAAANGGVGVLEQLLEAAPGDAAAAAAGSGRTPLHCACRTGQVAAARLLVASGAALGAPDAGGGTPLHSAAEAGCVALVEFLVAGGADPGARNAAGCTPADLTHRTILRGFLKEQREAKEAASAALRPTPAARAPPEPLPPPSTSRSAPASTTAELREPSKPLSPAAPRAPRPAALGRAVALGGARPKAQALRIPLGAFPGGPPLPKWEEPPAGAATSERAPTAPGLVSKGSAVPARRQLLQRAGRSSQAARGGRGTAPAACALPGGGSEPGSFDRQLKQDSASRLREYDDRREHRGNVLEKLAPHLRRKWASKLQGASEGARGRGGSAGQIFGREGAVSVEDAPPAPGSSSQDRFLAQYGLSGNPAFSVPTRV